MSDTNELYASVLSACVYGMHLLYLVAAVVAFVKLRASAAGMLVGGGLLVTTFCGLGVKLYRGVAIDPALRSLDANVEDVMRQLQAAHATTWCTSTVCWIAIAIGIALIPRALAPKPSPGAP